MDRPIAMKKDGIQTRKRKPKSSSNSNCGTKDSSKNKAQMYSYQTRQPKMSDTYSTVGSHIEDHRSIPGKVS